MGKQTVFISGPMSGIPGFNRDTFRSAEIHFRNAGYAVINPAVLPTDLDDSKYTPICLAMIDQSDIVFMLDGWKESRGARLERDYAIRCGKIIFDSEPKDHDRA